MPPERNFLPAPQHYGLQVGFVVDGNGDCVRSHLKTFVFIYTKSTKVILWVPYKGPYLDSNLWTQRQRPKGETDQLSILFTSNTKIQLLAGG